MRVILQRVSHASVSVKQTVVGEINTGLLILLGITHEDLQEDIDWLIQKITQLRIFNDENGKMNLSCENVNGEYLVISQFTLFADCKKGNRPSFIRSAAPAFAENMYFDFCKCLEKITNKKIETGVFGADMKVQLLNDGPVTIILDSKNRDI